VILLVSLLYSCCKILFMWCCRILLGYFVFCFTSARENTYIVRQNLRDSLYLIFRWETVSINFLQLLLRSNITSTTLWRFVLAPSATDRFQCHESFIDLSQCPRIALVNAFLVRCFFIRELFGHSIQSSMLRSTTWAYTLILNFKVKPCLERMNKPPI
jgi:hypothetical protein